MKAAVQDSPVDTRDSLSAGAPSAEARWPLGWTALLVAAVSLGLWLLLAAVARGLVG